MTSHHERFSGRARVYKKYRSHYPAWVMEVLRERCGLVREHVVADVGAGTGMLAELFLEAGHPVIAIEPNAAMRAACEELGKRYPQLRVVDASAEATGLTASSVDVVGVGRAFHWFNQQRALTEFARVLRPGGWIVLASYRRDAEASGQARGYEEILHAHRGGDTVAKGGQRSVLGQFAVQEGEVFELKTRLAESLSLAEFLGATQSYSSVPMEGEAGFREMQAEFTAFFERWAVDGALRVEMVCEVAACRVS